MHFEGVYIEAASNLKELDIDGSIFTGPPNTQNGIFTLLDPNIPIEIPDDKQYDADFYMLYSCGNSLERLSMKGVRYLTVHDLFPRDIMLDRPDYFATEEYNHDEGDIPQSALIKFIRNAPPSLCWFRSDLSNDNMDMLRLERPGIEFVN